MDFIVHWYLKILKKYIISLKRIFKMNESYGHELDFAREYMFVFPIREAPGYHIHFTKNCPEEIRNKVLELYPKLIEETKRRHEEGLYTSKDYFF